MMHPIVTRMAFAVSTLTGTLPSVPKEADPTLRLMLYDSMLSLIPEFISTCLEDDTIGPVAFVVKSMLQVASAKQSHGKEERLCALRVLCALFHGNGDNGVFLGGTVSMLVALVMGHATEPKEVVIRAVQVVMVVIKTSCILGDTVGRVVVALSKLQTVGVPEICTDLLDLVGNGNIHEDIRCAAGHVIATIGPFHKDPKMPDEISRRLIQRYRNDPRYARQLIFLATDQCGSAENAIIDSIFTIVVEDYSLNLRQPIIIAFDESHVFDQSVLEESLKSAVSKVPLLSELSFATGAPSLLPHVVGIIEKTDKTRLKDMIEESRSNGNIQATLKYAALYVGMKDIDMEFIANTLVDLQPSGEPLNLILLHIIHIFLYSQQKPDYLITGAMLTWLLPKLFGQSHLVRQSAILCLSKLISPVKTLMELCIDYKEFLFDTISQELSEPCLFPEGPILLCALVNVLPVDQALLFLEPFILRIEEIIESRPASSYVAECLHCLLNVIMISKNANRVLILNSNGGTLDEQQAKPVVLNDTIVERLFSSSVNLLSSDDEYTRGKSVQVVGGVLRLLQYPSQ